MDNQTIKELITQDENEKLEFKSSLRWDYKQNKINKDLQDVILKAISALMNSEGGNLLIGVDDSGNILGLEPDYQTLPKKNRDGFELIIRNLISDNFGAEVSHSVKIKFPSIEDKEICIISVSAMDNAIYFKDELYIRNGNSTKKLSTKEAINYYLKRWNHNRQKIENRFFQLLNLLQSTLNEKDSKGIPYKEKIKKNLDIILRDTLNGWAENITRSLDFFKNKYFKQKKEFDLYLNSLFNIVDFIDKCDKNDLRENERKEYIKILKSQLSNSEIRLLVYYLIFDDDKNFSNLINKYSLTENFSLERRDEYLFKTYQINISQEITIMK